MAEMDIVPYIGTRTPADFDTLFDELEAARGSSASLSDAIAEKADNATTLSGYGITDAYTKTEIDTALSGKQNKLSQSQLAAANSGITAEKLTADEAALAEVVDAGAKNFAQTESGSATQYAKIKCAVPAGKYKIYFTSLVSNDTDATNCQIYFHDRQSIVSSRGSINRGTGVVSNDITVNSDAEWIWIYASDVLSNSSGDTLSFSGAMCCTKAAWDVSHAFAPYCPSMAEMYEMIQALQSGTRSAPALAMAEPEEIKEPETGEEEMR